MTFPEAFRLAPAGEYDSHTPPVLTHCAGILCKACLEPIIVPGIVPGTVPGMLPGAVFGLLPGTFCKFGSRQSGGAQTQLGSVIKFEYVKTCHCVNVSLYFANYSLLLLLLLVLAQVREMAVDTKILVQFLEQCYIEILAWMQVCNR